MPKQVSPLWQRLFAIYVLSVALTVGTLLPDATTRLLAVASILLVLYENNKRRGLSMFTLRLNERISVAEFFDSTVISACLAAGSLILAFSPMNFGYSSGMSEAVLASLPSLFITIVTLVVAIATLKVAAQTKTIQKSESEAQLRQERREFADAVDRYAFWFCEQVALGKEVTPPDALSRDTFVLQRWSERIDQPGATWLWIWTKSILNGLRDRSNDLLPFEEAMHIANVGSAWVADGSKETIGREINRLNL